MLCIRQNQTKVVVRYGLCQMVSCAVIIYKRMQRGKQEQTVKCTETKTIMINNAEGSRERYRKPNEKLGAKGISEVRRERESVWNKVKPKYSQHLKSEMLSSTYSTRIVTDFSSDSSVQDRQHDTHRILNSIENLNEFSPVRSSINPALISSFKISPLDQNYLFKCVKPSNTNMTIQYKANVACIQVQFSVFFFHNYLT